jgi:hypothetical protein
LILLGIAGAFHGPVIGISFSTVTGSIARLFQFHRPLIKA